MPILAAVSAARKPAPRSTHSLIGESLTRPPIRPKRRRDCVQSLPERYRVLCPPGTRAFLGAFFAPRKTAEPADSANEELVFRTSVRIDLFHSSFVTFAGFVVSLILLNAKRRGFLFRATGLVATLPNPSSGTYSTTHTS